MAVVVAGKRKLTYVEYALTPEERQVTVYARSAQRLAALESGHGEVTSQLVGDTVAIRQIW